MKRLHTVGKVIAARKHSSSSCSGKLGLPRSRYDV